MCAEACGGVEDTLRAIRTPFNEFAAAVDAVAILLAVVAERHAVRTNQVVITHCVVQGAGEGNGVQERKQ